MFTKIFTVKLLTKKSTKLKFPVRNYIPRRALIYVPGDDIKKITKALSLDVDCIALDCEDGVAINKKENNKGSFGFKRPTGRKQFDLGVRVNSIDSGLCHEDLKSCLSGSFVPDTILLPKVESIEHLNWFADELDRLIRTENKVNLIIYIESTIAFVNLSDICKTAVQLSERHKFVPTSLVFGSDDFCASIGATRTEGSSEILYARQKLVLFAKAFNLQAIDLVYIKYKDLHGLRAQSEEGMKMGFTGKQVIHPGQVSIVQEAFLPTKSQIEWAEGLLKAFEDHQKSGKGAFTYQGSMIDMPTMKQARNIMDLANFAK